MKMLKNNPIYGKIQIWGKQFLNMCNSYLGIYSIETYQALFFKRAFNIIKETFSYKFNFMEAK